MVRQGWRGHLWQERFHSFVMDEGYLMYAARYGALNPVAAGLVARPEEWRWSSARAHSVGRDDRVVRVRPLLDRVGDWRTFIEGGIEAVMAKRLDQHLQTERPLGSDDWIAALEQRLGRPLAAKRPGRPRKQATDHE